MAREPTFEIAVEGDVQSRSKLLVGTADIGGANVTSLDHLVETIGTTQIGHVATRNLSDITPITDGKPRHPMRIYNADDSEITILFSEAFMPVWAADPLVDTLSEWTTTNNIEEITVLNSVPFPHNEQDHAVYYAGTDAYREKHFVENSRTSIGPLPGGVLDGVIGEMLARGLSDEFPSVGALVTPSHPPGPDFDAAARLLNALKVLYGIDVDEEGLKRREDEMKQYYEELLERLRTMQDDSRSMRDRDFPDEGMYM